MSQETFENLLRLVGSLVTQAKKVVREPLSAPERLPLTIHYLAYDDRYHSMSFSNCIAKSFLL